MKKYYILTIFVLAAVVISYSYQGISPEKNDELFVLVKYKSLPDKKLDAIAGLKQLIEQVKKEPHYGNISIYSDPTDPTNILLQEQWKSEEYYKGDHMKTPHLQKFINESRNFLAGPPEITFWKVVK